MGELAWCESVGAAGNTWHLRFLTETGRHLGGGIDSDSLCGRVKSGWGWDLSPDVDLTTAERMAETIDHTGRQACRECVTRASTEPLCPSCGDNGDCGETAVECGNEFHGDGRY